MKAFSGGQPSWIRRTVALLLKVPKDLIVIKRSPLIEAGEDHVSFLGHIVGNSNFLLTVPG